MYFLKYLTKDIKKKLEYVRLFKKMVKDLSKRCKVISSIFLKSRRLYSLVIAINACET